MTDEAIVDDGSKTVELKKAITAHDAQISTLKFRAPTAADIMAIGNPVKLDFDAGGKGEIEFNDARMGAMISLLGNIPPSSVKQMAPRDFVNCCWTLRNFFLPE